MLANVTKERGHGESSALGPFSDSYTVASFGVPLGSITENSWNGQFAGGRFILSL
jgi:hypothetical protein